MTSAAGRRAPGDDEPRRARSERFARSSSGLGLGRRRLQRRRRQRLPRRTPPPRRSATARSAVTADSPSYPERHRELALRRSPRSSASATSSSAPPRWNAPEYGANPSNRCYYCKQELFARLTALARERGIAAVVDGNNADDRGDYRPGRAGGPRVRRAQPARRGGSHARPTSASCRAGAACRPGTSRRPRACRRAFRTTREVTDEKLRMIEQAEDVLRSLGFRHCRVRHHGDVARLEVPPTRCRGRSTRTSGPRS